MALREIIARFGFQVDQRGLKQAETGISGVIGSFRTFGAVIAGSAIVRGVSNFVGEIVKVGDELGKTSKQLGLGVNELQAWQIAAQLSGASTQELTVGLRTLAKNALLAQQGSKQAADAYKSLGVEVEDASGNLKDTNTLFRETGLALGKVTNNTERTALAQQLLGRSGVKLIPIFEKGEAALDDLLGKLEEYGGGIGPDAVKLSEEAADQFLLFDLATDSLKSKLAVALLPILNQVVGGLSRLITWISKAAENTGLFKSLIASLGLVLGRVAIAKFGGSILRLGRAALVPLLKFALLFLVIDDLIALFEGRGSVIGTFIDKIFGKGTAKAVVDAIKGVGKAVSDVIKTGDFEAFDKALEDIFGPPGQDIVADIVFTFDLVKEALDQFIDETGEGLDLVIADFKAWVGDLGDAIGAGALGIANDAADFGQAIIDGIIKAIKDGATAVVDTLGDVAKGAIAGAKKLIGANSPSTLAAKEVGAPLPQGVAMGAIDAARAAARRTAGALAVASTLASPTSVAAPSRAPRGGATNGGVAAGGVVFKSEINLTVNGGSASDPSIQKLRQGLRSELRDNRRATLDALTQRVEAT